MFSVITCQFLLHSRMDDLFKTALFFIHNTKCSIRCQMPSYDWFNSDRDRPLWKSVACEQLSGTRNYGDRYVHSCLHGKYSPPTSEQLNMHQQLQNCTHPILST